MVKRYVIDARAVGEEAFRRAFDALLNAYAPNLLRAKVDAVTGYRNLPPRVQQSLDQLRGIGTTARQERRGAMWKRFVSLSSDPMMAVDLDLKLCRHRELLREFGPFSIHAEIFIDGHAAPVIAVEDGVTIIFEADGRVLDVIIAAGLSRECLVELP